MIPADWETTDPVNDLAELKEKRLISKIAKDDYCQRENHCSLRTSWSPDSRWCAVEYGERYGFGLVFVLEIEGRTLKQTDVGRHVQRALDSAIARQSRGKERQR